MDDLLYTSRDVRNAIIKLFSQSKGRRVAVSAFVGTGAEALLPRPKGLELICWPKEGGTNPGVLRELMKKGVDVRFSDSLHMKVYWTKDLGAIITSANLSDNALGSGNLREFGVKLDSNTIDIDRVIESVKSRSVTTSELRRLDRRHRIYWRNNRGKPWRESNAMSFPEWLKSPSREAWKMCGCDGEVDLAQEAKGHIKRNYPDVFEANNWIGWIRVGAYKMGDYVLEFELRDGRGLEWFYVDYALKVKPNENKEIYNPNLPAQIVQIWGKYHAPPPFRIDPEFRRAFSKAISKFDKHEIEGFVRPPRRLLDAIMECYT